jgi:lincosamide nucleotidyltransferase A/C/D/E
MLEKLMSSSDAIVLYSDIECLGIDLWIDGGWAVDALLGKQTRPHSDLDIVIQQRDVPRLWDLLESHGYADVPRDDTRPWNFVLGDADGREVDVHVVVLDDKGDGIYGPIENGEMYAAAALSGAGMIDGRTVRCISPEYLVKFHSGYNLRPSDYADVSALCERFGIEKPEEYARAAGPSAPVRGL